MKRLILAGLSAIALTATATLPATALNNRFDAAHQQTMNKLNDRFEKAHQDTLNKLNSRFEKSYQDTLNR
jgi:hypothetical protein